MIPMKKVLLTVFFLLLSFVSTHGVKAAIVNWDRKCDYSTSVSLPNVDDSGSNVTVDYTFSIFIYKEDDGSHVIVGADSNGLAGQSAICPYYFKTNNISKSSYFIPVLDTTTANYDSCPTAALAKACSGNPLYYLDSDSTLPGISDRSSGGNYSVIRNSVQLLFTNNRYTSTFSESDSCKKATFDMKKETLGTDISITPPGSEEPIPVDVICPFCIETSGAWKFIGTIVFFLKILVPVILIVFASIDLGKTVVSHDADSLSKAVQVIVQRIILGLIIFFIPSIVNIVFALVNNYSDIADKSTACMDCLLTPFSDECEEHISENKTCIAGLADATNGTGEAEQ